MPDLVGKELDYNLGAVYVTWEDQGDSTFAKRLSVRGAVWDPIGLSWVRAQQSVLKTDTLSVSADVSDRSGRLLGHVTVDNTVNVAGTFWQAEQPVRLPSDAVQAKYDGSGNLIYYATAPAGSATSASAWGIKKLTYDGSGNFLYWQWANGSSARTNIFDNYAGFSYS